MGRTLTWLMVGNFVSNIWKTGGGRVCWRTCSSCWGCPQTAMALVRWSTPFSNSPEPKTKWKQKNLNYYCNLSNLRLQQHTSTSPIEWKHLLNLMTSEFCFPSSEINVRCVKEADLVTAAPLPARSPSKRISARLQGPSNLETLM